MKIRILIGLVIILAVINAMMIIGTTQLQEQINDQKLRVLRLNTELMASEAVINDLEQRNNELIDARMDFNALRTVIENYEYTNMETLNKLDAIMQEVE